MSNKPDERIEECPPKDHMRTGVREVRKRGRKPTKLERVKDAMRRDIREGRHTDASLRDMLQKSLATNYNVSRDTACKARDVVLSEFAENSIHDK